MNEQRKSSRFDVQLPVEVLRIGANKGSRLGRTRNVSSNGALFSLAAPVELGASVEYVITLVNAGEARVTLRCMGKVVRVEKAIPSEGEVLVAATLERYEFRRALMHTLVTGA